MKTYQIQVTREGDQWLADVPQLEGTQTYAANLTALDRYVREIIVLGDDLPDSAMPDLQLVWSYNIGDQAGEEANRIREERAALAAKEKELEAATKAAAGKLIKDLGLSVRDAGPLLGISHQRVAQLHPAQKRPTAAAATSVSAAVQKAPTEKTAVSTGRRATPTPKGQRTN